MRKILLALLIISLHGCILTDDDQIDLDQSVYFEGEYINYAWGYSHYGFYIDGEGNIYSYRYNNNDDAWQYRDKKELTEDEIMLKYQANKQLVGIIDLSTLRQKALLIGNAVLKGSVSDTQQVGADMGQTNYICYYINSNDLYQPVILSSDGDFEYHRTSEEAASLVQWLKGFNLHE